MNEMDRYLEGYGREELKDPVTKAVLHHFETFCAVPHGSGHEQALTEILEKKLRAEGRKTRIDSGGNLIVDIPASEGCGDAPLLMLQGHIDMVCAVRPGSGYEPEKDRIQVTVETDRESGRAVLASTGDSSLGADCGLGDAAILWMFANRADENDSACTEEPQHGPVRIVLTTREENGLGGALELDPKVFEGVGYVINVDGFECGKFVAGSAGGRREKYRRPAESAGIRQLIGRNLTGARAYEICIKGFTGGHSGADIAEGRVNALWMMARFLRSLREREIPFGLASFTGGRALNAIPGDAQALVAVHGKNLPAFQECLRSFTADILAEYGETDGGGMVNFYETKMPFQVFDRESAEALVDFVSSLTIGVSAWMDSMPGTPATSCNLGVVDARVSAGKMDVHIFERSMGGPSHEMLLEEHRSLSEKNGFEKVYGQNYPAWEYGQENRLPALAEQTFRKITGSSGRVAVEHVGLEPAVFYGMDPSLQMVCMGADILDPHSINERVHLDTVAPFARTLRALVETVGSINNKGKN